MALRESSCVAAVCDGVGCSEEYGDYDTGAGWHFLSVEALVTSAEKDRVADEDGVDGAIEGWLITADGAVKCPTCRRREHCAEHGHTPVTRQAWTNPHSGETLPAFTYCDVCTWTLSGGES